MTANLVVHQTRRSVAAPRLVWKSLREPTAAVDTGESYSVSWKSLAAQWAADFLTKIDRRGTIKDKLCEAPDELIRPTHERRIALLYKGFLVPPAGLEPATP